MPTPRVGQGAFLLDTGAVLFYYGKYLGWCAPWNTQWGVVACTELAAGSGTFPLWPGALNVLSIVDFVPVVGRKYEVRARVWVGGGTPTTQVLLQIFTSVQAPPVRTDGDVFSDKRELGESLLTTTNAGTGDDPFGFDVTYVPVSTLKTTIWLAGGVLSGAVAALDANEGLPSSLKIVDIGPAANPHIT